MSPIVAGTLTAASQEGASQPAACSRRAARGDRGYSAQVSGVYLSTELFPRLGIADQVRAKSQRIERERVGAVVARGEAEIGFQQVSELLPIAGIDYVGPLPAEVQRVTVLSAGVASGSKSPEAARALIRFFTSPEGAQAMTKNGLEPMLPR